MKLNVQAIFNSVDGEINGFSGAGQLCTFIRLRGCNLRCVFCDTKYAQDGSVKDMKEVDEILDWPEMLNKVTITGGEPLFQDITSLVTALVASDKRVTIETNGSLVYPVWPLTNGLFDNVRFVVDYKLPSSGVEDKMNALVFEGLRQVDIIKFVILDFNDYYIARGLAVGNTKWEAKKVFSPAIVDQFDYTNWPAALAEMMIQDAAILQDVQFSLQVHKILWPNAKVER